jgi:hypothetical protein
MLCEKDCLKDEFLKMRLLGLVVRFLFCQIDDLVHLVITHEVMPHKLLPTGSSSSLGLRSVQILGSEMSD